MSNGMNEAAGAAGHPGRNRSHRFGGTRPRLAVAALFALLLSAACASSSPPLQVEHAPGKATRRAASANVVVSGQVSDATHIVLRRHELAKLYSKNRKEAIAALHAIVASGVGGSGDYFALAELSFYEAEQLQEEAFRQARRRDLRRRRGFKRRPSPYSKEDWALVAEARSYYLASTIYAYTVLFTRDEIDTVTRIDPRVWTSVDLYNRALGLAFQKDDGYDHFETAVLPVPFGSVEVRFAEADRIWGNRYMVDFLPSDEFVIKGLRNRYRRPGLGAPLAARTVPIDAGDPAGYLVAENAVVSATALLLIDDPRKQLEGDRVVASLRVEPWSEVETIEITGLEVPLEAQPSAALAASLQDSVVWQSRFGVFLGRITDLSDENRLFGWEPRLPGQIPVVFVHGTMSSPVVWADMVNDLQSDPLIRDRYQFLFYSYQSGNPIMYSSMLFRRALVQAHAALDPSGLDACMNEMVVVGHSQGGLLTKTTAIETKSIIADGLFGEPLEETNFNRRSKRILKEALFLEPLPFVDRVVFISTPHRGSYVAASAILRAFATRFIKFPGDLTALATDLTGALNEREHERDLRMRTSVDNMSPRNELIQLLASIPVDERIPAHSIISVKGDGPPEEGDDGVVKYTSAHIEEAESELVVNSGHSVQAHPKAIAEMRRILTEHANGTSCQTSAISAIDD